MGRKPVERLPFDPSPAPFTGATFALGDLEGARRAVRRTLRRFRRERAFDPCSGARMRPRAAARRRREQRRRSASNATRGDPEPGEPEAVADAVRAMGGASTLEIERAAFSVFHDCTRERYDAALALAVDAARVVLLDDGADVWIVSR